MNSNAELRADLLDVNVWIALADVDHQHHSEAKKYWASCTQRMAFCRATMQGFLRLVTQEAVMGKSVHTPQEAWGIYHAHLATGRCVFLPEPAGLELTLQTLSCQNGFRVRDWTDAYLASFAIRANCRMVSFDAGFAQYAGLPLLHLPLAAKRLPV